MSAGLRKVSDGLGKVSDGLRKELDGFWKLLRGSSNIRGSTKYRRKPFSFIEWSHKRVSQG